MGAELNIYTPSLSIFVLSCVHAPRVLFGLAFWLTLPRFRRRATRLTPQYMMAEAPASIPPDVLEAVCPAVVAVPEAPPVGNMNISGPPA